MVSELVKDLKDQKADVRINAANALANIGPEAKAAVPALIETLKDEKAYVRRAAGAALDKIRSDANAAPQSK